MPNFQKHILYGILFGTLFFFFTQNPIVLFIVAIYSTLPDLDISTSIPFRFYAIASAGYAIYMLILPQTFVSDFFGFEFPQRYFAIPPLVGLIILQFVPHREWLHSISAGIVFALPLWFFFGFTVFIGGLFGYYLHLILDKEFFDGLFT